MKVHQTAYIEALVDDQLSGWRRWMVRRHLSRCPGCAAVYRNHLHVRQLLKQHPPQVEMPESAAFFWSQVRRAIEAESPGATVVSEDAVELSPLERFWQAPAVAPLTSLALGVLLLMGLWWAFQPHGPLPHARTAQVTAVETTIPDTVATSFTDEEAQVTVIWVSGLPWTADMTEMQTLFAHLDG